jgi:TnpA family transposase
MTLARLLCFDLCPRLKALKDRHWFVRRGAEIPEAIRSICHAQVDVRKIADHWEAIGRLVASVHPGHGSATHALARFGAAVRGDPPYEAMVQLGKLLRTVFLVDYFVNATIRHELLRVLNRGEAVTALTRAICAGRIAGCQAKRDDEMQAVADALSLSASILMAWNTTERQAALDQRGTRRSTTVPPELIGRIAPTRTEGINRRGVFRFPIDHSADRLPPSLAA